MSRRKQPSPTKLGSKPPPSKPPGKPAAKKTQNPPLPGALIYAVAERFLHGPSGRQKPWTTSQLSKWLTDAGYPTSREEIYPIIRQAIDRGFLRLTPTRATGLLKPLGEKFPSMPADTRILDVKQANDGKERSPQAVIDSLAEEAADVVVRMIRTVADAKARGGDGQEGVNPAVHIGLGAGGTTQGVAEALARRLASERHLPPLVLHALSSGFDIDRPFDAPIAFFSYFTQINHPVEFVGLFCPAIVEWDDYDRVKGLQGIRQSIERASEIDIVVTSLAQAADDHGLLNTFLNIPGGRRPELAEAGHVGDVLMQPFSAKGPITVNTGIRAVTLFDLDGLVKMARARDKHVVLLAGPCVRCGVSKSEALRPLLQVPELRVCNHLITDFATAEGLLA